MHRLIVVGSPRADGRSAHLADELFNACIEEWPEEGVSIVSVAGMAIEPCVGCDGCREKCAVEDVPSPPDEDDLLEPHELAAGSDASRHQCVISDDVSEIRKHLDAADELIVVSPVYFSSVPAQLAALLDRMQPYFWSNLREHAHESGFRPMILHVVGEGSDPHGFEPLIGTVRSAFSVVGFQLEHVYDWVGKIADDGEILADADEFAISVPDDKTAQGSESLDDDRRTKSEERP